MPSNFPELQPPEDLRAALLGSVRRRASSFVGTLLLVEGEAELLDRVVRTVRPAAAGIRLSREVRLRVARGRALVRMDDQSDVWVEEGSLLDLSHWRQEERHLGLGRGRLLALVAPQSRRKFRVSSPAGTAVVTGTAFEFTFAGSRLQVSVMHGSVHVSNAHGQVDARRGMQVRATEASAPRRSSSDERAAGAPVWIGDISRSGDNPAIRSAFRAIEPAKFGGTKETRMGADDVQGKKRLGKSGRLLLAAAVTLLAVGGGGYQIKQHFDRQAELGRTQAEEGAGGGTHKQKRLVRVPRGADGKPDFSKQVVTASSGELVGREKRLAGGRSEDIPENVKGSVGGDIRAVMSAINALKQAGVSEAEAQERITRSLSESIGRQVSESGKTLPVNVKVSHDGKVLVGIGGFPEGKGAGPASPGAAEEQVGR